MVSTSTCTSGHSRRRRWISGRVRPPGIVRSRVTTSGTISRTRHSASWQSAAWPTTSMSGWELISIWRPDRRMAWSSAMSTRIFFMGPLRKGDADAQGRAAALQGLDGEGALEQADPLPEVGQGGARPGFSPQARAAGHFDVQADQARRTQEAEANAPGGRPAGPLPEALLGDAEQGRLQGRGQPVRLQVAGPQLHRDTAGPGVVRDITLQCGGQAQVV